MDEARGFVDFGLLRSSSSPPGYAAKAAPTAFMTKVFQIISPVMGSR